MNVLILTPDAVGGTLLERMLTIYMQFHDFDRPVIDVSHIELGLETYHCPVFNQMILRAKHDIEFREMQNLAEIRQCLDSVDHYKITKLSHYNLAVRQDPVREQAPFYRYLNEHFFIILCRRDNLFEHALSWALNKITGKLNIYTATDKISSFFSVFRDGVTLDPLSIKQSLDAYDRYVRWGETHFRAAAYYHYERDMPNIERYVLDLPIFAGQPQRLTWKDVYQQEFHEWNRCHYYSSDIGTVARLHRDRLLALAAPVESTPVRRPLSDPAEQAQSSWLQFQAAYQAVADATWPAIHSLEDWYGLPAHIRRECLDLHDIGYHLESVLIHQNQQQGRYSDPKHSGSMLIMQPSAVEILQNSIAEVHGDFLSVHQDRYRQASESIGRMVELGILPNTVPIKKQTLQDKQALIRNFDQCVDTYNAWISQHPDLGSPMTSQALRDHVRAESDAWGHHQSPQITA